MTWGNVATLVGAAITLVGAVRSLAPLGGWRAAFPPRVHNTVRAVTRRLRRPQVHHVGLHDGGAVVEGFAVVKATGLVLPNPATEPDRFIAAIAAQFGEMEKALDTARQDTARQDTARERADREAAVQAARDEAAFGIADAVNDTKRVELSGARTQLVGVLLVVVGVVADAITGGGG